MIQGIKHVFLFLKDGGVLMLFLGIASVIALAIVIERIWVFRNLTDYLKNISLRVKKLAEKKKLSEALRYCNDNPGPQSDLYNEIINYRELPLSELKERVQDLGKSMAPDIQKNISILGTIANISPLIGLLGTVTGMIRAFFSISAGGVGNPDLLASGIAEALITTATGLAIAIPAVIVYNYLVDYSKRIILSLEMNSIELIDIIKFQDKTIHAREEINAEAETETEIEVEDGEEI
ncbi:MAG TPA: MotA/TolQ/ExbB proton channel family protein [Firmicutes bacterium]|nr:MotA/TolQ/ExbB proton channel family protein [Bacillota bacterium]